MSVIHYLQWGDYPQIGDYLQVVDYLQVGGYLQVISKGQLMIIFLSHNDHNHQDKPLLRPKLCLELDRQ